MKDRLRWGDGIAPLVKPATSETTEVVAFLSDVHFPYADYDLLTSVYSLLKKIRPHRIVLNGDMCDFFQISRFNTGHERLDSLQAELDEASAFRLRLRKLLPNAVIDETEGNHDYRLMTYIRTNAPALGSLRALDPRALCNYEKLDIRWHPGHGFRLRPEFLVKHGTIARQDAGLTAKAELLMNGISGISGHVHRLATYTKNGYAKRSWTEQGCLCRLDPPYITGGANWEQGLAVGYFSTKSPNFVIDLVKYSDGVLWYGGRRY